jgi:hypothetical protein
MFEYKIVISLWLAIVKDKELAKALLTFLHLPYGPLFSSNTHRKHIRKLEELGVLHLSPYEGQIFLMQKYSLQNKEMTKVLTVNGVCKNEISLQQDIVISYYQICAVIYQLEEKRKNTLFLINFLEKYHTNNQHIRANKLNYKTKHNLMKCFLYFTRDLYRDEIQEIFKLGSLTAVTSLTNSLQESGWIKKYYNYTILKHGGYKEHEKRKKCKMINGYLCEQTANSIEFDTNFAFPFSYISSWFEKQLEYFEGLIEYFWQFDNNKTWEQFEEYILSGKYLKNKIEFKRKVSEVIIDTDGVIIALRSYIREFLRCKVFHQRLNKNKYYKQEVFDWGELLSHPESLRRLVYYDDQLQKDITCSKGQIKQFKWVEFQKESYTPNFK